MKPNWLLEKAHPVKYETQDQIIFPVDESVIRVAEKNMVNNIRYNYQNTYSMFYSVCKSNELKRQYEKEKGFTYDLVVRARTDMDFVQPLSILQEFESNRDSIWICGIGETSHGPHVDDKFAFSNSKNMDVYSSTFLQMQNLVKQTPYFHPETLLYEHLKNNSIDIRPSKSIFKIEQAHENTTEC